MDSSLSLFVLIRTTTAIASARRLTLHHYRWALPVAIHVVMHTIAIAIVDAVTVAPTPTLPRPLLQPRAL